MPEAAINFEGRRSKRSIFALRPEDWTTLSNGHHIQQIELTAAELQADEHPMFHRCADAHNAITTSFHTLDGSTPVIGVTHAVQKASVENPVPREPHPHAEKVTFHRDTPETRQVLQFHHLGVANDGKIHTAVFQNSDHKASEIATLMNQDGMAGATAVRASTIMQPTEGPHKGKFLYRKEPVQTEDGVNPAMVAFRNNESKYQPISHADGHQYYAVDSRTKGVLDTMTDQVPHVPFRAPTCAGVYVCVSGQVCD